MICTQEYCDCAECRENFRRNRPMSVDERTRSDATDVLAAALECNEIAVAAGKHHVAELLAVLRKIGGYMTPEQQLAIRVADAWVKQ